MALLFDEKAKSVGKFFSKGENMLRQYDDVEIKIIYLNNSDIVTASGDNYEDDPWGDLEY